MSYNFKDEIVIVTGGSRGIGRCVVEGFVKGGATTIFTYASSSQKADELVESLASESGRAIGVKVDIADTAAMGEFVTGIAKEYGRIDILVNNAGIIRDTLVMMMDSDNWLDVIQTNLTGAYNAIKPASRPMMRKKKGVIINMSSIAASKPGKGHCNYAASKGGIESMTMALAAELGSKNIRVNAVAPGMIETDMSKDVRDVAGDLILDAIPLKRYGKPEDIANAVLFLASDSASYITGEVLHVDGGL